MPPLPSVMVPLGSPCPDFRLRDPGTGLWTTRDGAAGPRGLLVMFICNHCPFVKHIRAELARLGSEYPARGIGVVGICSNDPHSHPQDGPEAMAAEARDAGYRFPYLSDETQDVARAFQAACTPDFFLYDAERRLVYRGQLCPSRPGSPTPVTGSHLRAALDAVAAGRPPAAEQVPSVGCSIKWRPGQPAAS